MWSFYQTNLSNFDFYIENPFILENISSFYESKTKQKKRIFCKYIEILKDLNNKNKNLFNLIVYQRFNINLSSIFCPSSISSYQKA